MNYKTFYVLSWTQEAKNYGVYLGTTVRPSITLLPGGGLQPEIFISSRLMLVSESSLQPYCSYTNIELQSGLDEFLVQAFAAVVIVLLV